MRILIQHESIYRYAEPASYSIQALHLRPLDTASQKVLSWHIQIPQGASLRETRDVYGNPLQTLYIERQHSEVPIYASGEVETLDTNGIACAPQERFVPRFYLRKTRLTEADEQIAVLALDAKTASDGTPLDLAHQLMNRVRDAVDYRIGKTDTETTAAEALAEGSGVCQDHAHIFLAAARFIGMPARYVSGYLFSGGEIEHDAGHAWAEAYIERLGWVGFDVANRICQTDAYVRVASGLDYLEAEPIRGLRRGGGQETLEVRLKVGEGASQQQ
jgi:transglutaminase-like putative cysteine protease